MLFTFTEFEPRQLRLTALARGEVTDRTVPGINMASDTPLAEAEDTGRDGPHVGHDSMGPQLEIQC